MNLSFEKQDAAWRRVAKKRRAICGYYDPPADAEITAITIPAGWPAYEQPPWLQPGHISYVISIYAKPVREKNGAELADQRVRWKPDPPTYDIPDRPPPPDFRTGRAKPYERDDTADADAFAWAFKQRASGFGFDPAKTDSRTSSHSSAYEELRRAVNSAFAYGQPAGPTPSQRHKRALQLLIATLPKGTKERADAEQLLRRIEEQER